MSLWEYEARLWQWNEAHGDGRDTGGDLPLPDRDAQQRLIDRINSDPVLNP